MITMMLQITILHLLLIANMASAGDVRLRGSRDEHMRDERKLPSDDMATLTHFGLDPNDYKETRGGSDTFVPCNDNKVCLPLSVIIDKIDDAILQRNVECRSVEGCSQGECRHVLNQGLLCDSGNQLRCQYECVYDDTAGDGNLPFL
jgi:hypothetical protein